MELLTHLSKRLTSRPNIQLPVNSLLEILQNPSSTTIIKVRVLQYMYIHTRMNSDTTVENHYGPQ